MPKAPGRSILSIHQLVEVHEWNEVLRKALPLLGDILEDPIGEVRPTGLRAAGVTLPVRDCGPTATGHVLVTILLQVEALEARVLLHELLSFSPCTHKAGINFSGDKEPIDVCVRLSCCGSNFPWKQSKQVYQLQRLMIYF